MPSPDNLSSTSNSSRPDYVKLVRFLVQPLIDDPTTLKVDCEQVNSSDKIWLRLAFEQEDKGKVFGRGGRNIQAIRTVINAAAIPFNQSVHLDVYGSDSQSDTNDRFSSGSPRSGGRRGRSSRRSSTPKPSPKLRPSS